MRRRRMGCMYITLDNHQHVTLFAVTFFFYPFSPFVSNLKTFQNWDSSN